MSKVPAALTKQEHDFLMRVIIENTRSRAFGGTWIEEVVKHGFKGYADASDATLLQEVFIGYPSLLISASTTTMPNRIKLMNLFVDPRAQELIGQLSEADLDTIKVTRDEIVAEPAMYIDQAKNIAELKPLVEPYIAAKSAFVSKVDLTRSTINF